MTSRSVAVLLGGPSAEHDVSLVSGRAVAAALSGRGHAVEGWLIDLEGGWWRLPAHALDVAIPAPRFDDPRALGATGPCSPAEALSELARQEPAPVAFIALHGPFGEDGTVQALCEAVDLVYTGCGVAASALGMDKPLFKRLIGGLGMPIVPSITVGAAEHARDERGTVRRVEAFAGGLPSRRVIVKPARLGSSVGISIVHRPDEPPELEMALAAAFRHDTIALVEAYLPGPRELEASVVGNGADDVEVYGPGEIFPGHEFYDFSAKYAEGVSRTTDRPELADGIRDRVRALARDAYLAIGGEGFARIDFLLDGDGLYVSEINTIPGFTPISLFPVLCREGGYDFGAIAERIVGLALERAAYRPRRRLTRASLP